MYYYTSSPSLTIYQTQFGEQMARLGDLLIKPPAEEWPLLMVLSRDIPMSVAEVKSRLADNTGQKLSTDRITKMLDDLVSRWLVDRTEK